MKNRQKPRPRSRRIYRPLNSQEFSRRMEESFSPVYLTSISIIQGGALALLCQQAFSLDINQILRGKGFETVLYITLSFFSIVSVSYEYNWFVGIHRWSQKYLDTAIPFFLGFFEIGAIFNISHPRRWWFMTALFSFVGATAYFNTWKNTKETMFEDKGLFRYFRANMLISILIAIIGLLFGAVVTAFYPVLKGNRFWYRVDLPLCIFFLALFGGIVWKDTRFIDHLHDRFGTES